MALRTPHSSTSTAHLLYSPPERERVNKYIHVAYRLPFDSFDFIIFVAAAAAQRRVAFVFVLPLFFLYLPVCAKFRLATPTNRNQPPPINAIYEHSVVELRVRSLKERKRKEKKEKKEDERETTAAWLRFVTPLQTKMPARFSGVNGAV